jgi:hypothetical protein
MDHFRVCLVDTAFCHFGLRLVFMFMRWMALQVLRLPGAAALCIKHGQADARASPSSPPSHEMTDGLKRRKKRMLSVEPEPESILENIRLLSSNMSDIHPMGVLCRMYTMHQMALTVAVLSEAL